MRPAVTASKLELVRGDGPASGPRESEVVESYRRLADVFHEVLAEQTLDALLERIADTLADLVPHESMTIYEADEAQGLLNPVLARYDWAEEVMRKTVRFERASRAGPPAVASRCC